MCPSCDLTVDMFVDTQAMIIPSHPATRLPWLSKASLSPVTFPAWTLLPAAHGRQTMLKVELQVKAFSHAFNGVQAVTYNVDLSTEGFDSGIRVAELLGKGEYLCILE